MKITNQGQIKNIGGESGGRHTPEKPIHQMAQGERFRARVMDIQPTRVTLQLADGQTLTAKSQVLPDARIGEDAVFQVKENMNGQILLEMVRQDGQIPKGFIQEALIHAGLFATEENIKLAQTLLENNLPLDTATLQKATFFNYAGEELSMEKLSMEKIVFLLKENFPADAVSMETLNKIADGSLKLNDTLEKISSQLLSEETALPPDLRKELFTILLGKDKLDIIGTFSEPPGAEQLKKLKAAALEKLFIRLSDKTSLSETGEYFKELHRAVTEMEKSIERSEQPHLRKELSDAKDTLEFMNQIKDYKEYLQIPLLIRQDQKQGELYIFKNERNRKNKKTLTENASVLLALDFEHLGHVEVLIKKSKMELNFQFRARTDAALKTMAAAFPKLSESLAVEGFSVSGTSFKKISEEISVEKEAEGRPEREKKRFSFDMRV